MKENRGPDARESKKVKRRLVWLVAGVPALLVLVVLIVAYSFDGEALKQGAIDRVRAETGRELRLDGPLELQFFPRLALELHDLHLSGPDGKGEFLALGQASGAVDVLPLLWGKVVLNRLEVRDLELRAVRHADGRTNFDDLLAERQATDSPLVLEMEKLVLLNGRFSWQDQQLGLDLHLEDVFLRTGQLGRQAQGKLEMGGQLREGETLLNLRLESLYRLDMEGDLLQLDGLNLGLRGQGAGLQQARGELGIRRLRLHPGARESLLEQGSLQVEGLWQAARLEGGLTLGRLEWKDRAVRLEQLALRLARGEEEPALKLQLDMDSLEATGQDWKTSPARFSWSGRWQGLELQGQLSSPLSFAAGQLQAGALEGSGRVLQSQWLRQPFPEISISGALQADVGRRSAQGRLVLGLDDSTLAGDWQFLGAAPARLSFQASLDQLNLDRYLLPVTPGDKPAARSPKPVPALPQASREAEGLELDGRLRIGRLQYRQLKLEHLESRIRWRQGRFEAAPLSARLYQGRTKGSLAWEGQFLWRQLFRNVALAPLSQDGLGRELLSGRGDLQLELQGPAADLRGELLLQARNGAIPGLDLVGALNQAGPGAAGLLPVAAGKTPYKELKARIHLAPGLADLRRLSLKSPSLRLEATARADLAGNRLEGEGMVQIAGSAREWGRANWERWQGRHLPLVLRGSPEAPAWALNLAGQGAGQSPPVRLAAGGGWNLGGRKLWLPEWLP